MSLSRQEIVGLFGGGGILVGLSFCLFALVVGLGSFLLFWFGIFLLLLGVFCGRLVAFLSKPPVKIPVCLE